MYAFFSPQGTVAATAQITPTRAVYSTADLLPVTVGGPPLRHTSRSNLMTETARTIISVPVGVVAFLLAQLSAAPSFAADYDVGSIHIAQPWSRATPKGAKAGAGYMTITNKGTTPDKVSCVSDDASAQCEIHSMTMEGGVMKMRPVEGGGRNRHARALGLPCHVPRTQASA
jgi:hypothetical protein